MSTPKISDTTTDESLLGRRDAFHVPGVLVKSNQIVLPGQYVRFTDRTLKNQVRPTQAALAHGVVDPFLNGRVEPGILFWVFPRPQLVQDFVHVFALTLPAEPEEDLDDDEEDYLDDDEEDDEDDDESCRGCYS